MKRMMKPYSLSVCLLSLGLTIEFSSGSRQQDFFPLPPDLAVDGDDYNGNDDVWSASSNVSSTEENCPLDCMNGSVCQRGDQQLYGHGQDPATGGAFTFHQQLHQNGWSCACPMGFTGLTCNITYINCNDGEHVCYNGGSCIDELTDVLDSEKLFCDCSTAIDSQNSNTIFVGKYCEMKTIDHIEHCGPLSFCLNGGWCQIDGRQDVQPCECPDGFFGKYCEYVDSTVPQCSKECLNGGFCRLNSDNGLSNGAEVCECPPKYYGDSCEKEGEACGEGQYCLHGSKCFEIILANGKTEHMCDCTRAYTSTKYFAGEFCQYPSTQFCTGEDDPNGRQFCTNGGQCPEEPYKPCSCPPGFSNPRCAFEIGTDGGDYAECTLKCANGGTCQEGVKDIDEVYGQFSSDIVDMIDELQINFEHCVCPKGFYGVRCEYEITPCDDSQYACFHGATCYSDGGRVGCNCEDADRLTAGLYCEFFATAHCSKQTEPSEDGFRGFCTNGGTCDGDDGCICPEGFEGPHCEYKTEDMDSLDTMAAKSPNTTRIKNKKTTMGAIISSSVIAGFVIIKVLIFIIYNRSRQAINEETPSEGHEQSDDCRGGGSYLAATEVL